MNNIDLGWAGIIHWPVEEVVASMATTIKHDALISVVCKGVRIASKEKSSTYTKEYGLAQSFDPRDDIFTWVEQDGINGIRHASKEDVKQCKKNGMVVHDHRRWGYIFAHKYHMHQKVQFTDTIPFLNGYAQITLTGTIVGIVVVGIASKTLWSDKLEPEIGNVYYKVNTDALWYAKELANNHPIRTVHESKITHVSWQ